MMGRTPILIKPILEGMKSETSLETKILMLLEDNTTSSIEFRGNELFKYEPTENTYSTSSPIPQENWTLTEQQAEDFFNLLHQHIRENTNLEITKRHKELDIRFGDYYVYMIMKSNHYLIPTLIIKKYG